ncbi:MAG: caspase family protein [Chitinophagaceae bacterium]
MRFPILFIYLVFLSTATKAQDIFELTYQFKYDPGKTIYKGLFFKHSPNSAFLRLSAINNKTKKRVLYDFTISLTETDIENNTQQNSKSFQIKDSTNKNYWYCRSADFRIKEGTEIFNFDYLRFWFIQDEQKQLFEPCLTTPYKVPDSSLRLNSITEVVKNPIVLDSSARMKQQFDKTDILSFKKLKNSTFSKNYLQQFFTRTELFYEGAYTKKQVQTIRENEKPVIYLISVINTDDKDISETCVADGIKVSAYFNRVAEFLDLPYTVRKIKGNDFTVKNVKTAIANIFPGKNDIVVFHYSGHGYRWKDDNTLLFPQLGLYYGTPISWAFMKASSINLEEIYQSIAVKGARLTLVLGDCCNTEVKKRRLEIKDTALDKVPTGYYDMNRSMAEELFLNSRSSLLIAAAKQGQLANCSVAYKGFLTTSVIEAIRLSLKNEGSNPTWMNIIIKAEAGTLKLAYQYKVVQNIIYRLCEAESGIKCIDNLKYNTGN